MPHETPKRVVYAKSHRRTSPRRLTPAFRPPLYHEAVGQEDQGLVLLFSPLEPSRGRTAAVSEPASGPTRRRGGGSDGGDLTVGQLADRCPTRNRCLADARALALRTLHDSCVRCRRVAKAFGRDCRVGHQNVPPMGWRPATSTGRGRWRTTLATGCSGPPSPEAKPAADARRRVLRVGDQGVASVPARPRPPRGNMGQLISARTLGSLVLRLGRRRSATDDVRRQVCPWRAVIDR
jgi:hypothetical protein